ncbi:MAG: glycosyltransferase [Bacteroidetes bacterium]|nr:glycosyltransferase [Bacteroidota bacterium]
MKNLLILCDAFPPDFAPRMGYLCKYLKNLDWNPIIVTEYSPRNIFPDLAKEQNVTYINFYFSKNKLWQKIKYIFVFLLDFLFNYKNYIIRKKAEKIITQTEISLILTSTFKIFPTLAACQLSKKHTIPFVVDFRDIFEQTPNNELISKRVTNSAFINRIIASGITKKLLRQRSTILQQARAVTTVSEWHKEFLSQYNSNTHLIYNGFDSDLFYPQKIESDNFIISYTGRIESREIKDPSLFFEAIAQLLAEKKLDVETLKIQFYVIDKNSKQIIQNCAKEYKILDFIDIFNSVSNFEIPEILNKSSVLLLLANKLPKGIVGTKIFEYMAVEKPILCVRNDEGVLQEVINRANAGIAASTVEETEKFLLEKYVEWQKNGFTQQNGNREYVKQFSRKRQAEQFVKFFENLFPNS